MGNQEVDELVTGLILGAEAVVGLLGGIAMAQRVSAPFLRKVIGALCIGLGAFLFLRQAGCF